MFASFNRPGFAGWCGLQSTGDHMRALFLIIGASSFAVACPSLAKEKQTETLDVGSPPLRPIAAAKAYFAGVLKDPYSAEYRQLSEPYAGRCRGGLAGKGWRGYAVHVGINARNSYGGYTGETIYTVLYVNGTAVNAVEGANFGAYAPAKGFLGLEGAGVCRKVNAPQDQLRKGDPLFPG